MFGTQVMQGNTEVAGSNTEYNHASPCSQTSQDQSNEEPAALGRRVLRDDGRCRDTPHVQPHHLHKRNGQRRYIRVGHQVISFVFGSGKMWHTPYWAMSICDVLETLKVRFGSPGTWRVKGTDTVTCTTSP